MWTLVRQVGGEGDDRDQALSKLVQVYWPPVYSFLRRSGKAREEAAELTQAFFAEVVLGRKILESADQSRGRLRSLLITSLKRYLIDRHRRTSVRVHERAAHFDRDRLDREEALIAGARGDDPEAGFDRRWAMAQVEEALRRTEEHFRTTGKPSHWEVFNARLVRPSVSHVDPPPLARLAPELGFKSAADAAAAVQVVKKRFDVLLREVIAETTDEGADLDDEYRYLLKLMG